MSWGRCQYLEITSLFFCTFIEKKGSSKINIIAGGHSYYTNILLNIEQQLTAILLMPKRDEEVKETYQRFEQKRVINIWVMVKEMVPNTRKVLITVDDWVR